MRLEKKCLEAIRRHAKRGLRQVTNELVVLRSITIK